MAQGHGAKLKGKSPKVNRNPGVTKKGARTYTPKAAVLAKQKKLAKKLTASVTGQIERQMAMKARQSGKLTIMKGLADKAIAEDRKAKELREKKKKS